jgi:hypothetical protein
MVNGKVLNGVEMSLPRVVKKKWEILRAWNLDQEVRRVPHQRYREHSVDSVRNRTANMK